MITVARLVAAALILVLGGCSGRELPPAADQTGSPPEYRIGPGDALQIFVWRNPELSLTVPVRPDGRISIPLVQDVVAFDKTPMELGAEIQQKLKRFVQDAEVTVIVQSFVGPFTQQVRVIGEASKPAAVPYRANMTVLDVMIQVGGLTKFAAGNRAVIVRRVTGEEHTYPVYLDSLINAGDVKYNAPMEPGDILIIPQTYF
jgi:polysaccharide export outer membrane protein